MKSFIVVFIACLLTASVMAQTPNLDTAVYKLFSALKANDETSFLKLYPSGEQINRMMRAILEPQIPVMRTQLKKAKETNPEMKDINVDSLIEQSLAEYSNPDFMKKALNKASGNFRKIIANGENIGVKWQAAEFLSYEPDSAYMNNGLNKLREAETGAKTFKGIINLKSLDSTYRISVDKIIYMPLEKGWFGGEFKQIIRKGESFTKEDDLETQEITITETREEAPPPPPPPIKTKSKTSAIKKKGKTKS